MKMKKKAMATFLSVCMLAAVVVPTTIASATATTPTSKEGTSGNDAGTTPENNENQDTENPDTQEPPVTTKAVTVTDDKGVETQHDTLPEAVKAATKGSTIKLNEDVKLDTTLQITTGIKLDGGNHKIGAGDSFTPLSEQISALIVVITPDEFVLQNVVIDGGATNKFPLNIYTSPKVALNGVTVNNLFTKGGAMLVNASNVTVGGPLTISTTADSWYGINVDSGSGVESTTATLLFTKDADFKYTNNAGKYNPQGPAAICVDNVKKHNNENAVLYPNYAGLSAPTYDEAKDQNLFYLGTRVNKLELDKIELTLKPGATEKLNATVTPEDASYPTVHFSSSDEKVATVDKDGNVTAVANGTATITATADAQTATCTVTVKSDEVTPPPTPTPPDTNVVAPTPELTPPVVAGDSTNVDAKVEVPQADLDQATAENPVTIKVDLPTDSLKQTIAESTTDHVALSVEIPDSAITNANVSMAQIGLEKGVFAQLKESGKTMTIHVAGSNGKDIYSWTFDGSEVQDTNINVNLALNVDSSENKTEIKDALGDKQGTVLSFAHQGVLPAKATIKVDVSASFKAGETAYFYYYNPETKAMEAIGDGYVVDADGFVSVSITHCSDYVLTKEKLPVQAGTNNDNSITSPQTGDNTNLAISIAAVTAAGAAITGFVVMKKRKTN